MPEKTLYIEIFQPFAQYRNPFTFYYAQTYPLPPKSTIIGMLQNATNRYYDKDFWSLKISIHGGFESYFWNYQQLIKGDIGLKIRGNKPELWNQKRPLYGSILKSQRTPVHQQELFNGRLFLFIKSNAGLIEEIKESVEKPKKILSLGRSEDIIFIKDVKELGRNEIEEKEVKKNIWMTYPTYILKTYGKGENKESFPIRNKRFPVYSIPTKVIFKNNNVPVKNKAEITKNTKRETDFETVIHVAYNSTIYLEKTINIDKIKVNKKTFKIVQKWGWL